MRSLLAVVCAFLMTAAVARAEQPAFDLHGYFDLEAEVSNKDDRGENWTFDQHHFNLIVQFRLSPSLNVLGELEWEHGIDVEAGQGVGRLYIARSWLEYTASEPLRVRVGKFLPPFGIFNELHDATPTFLATNLPASLYGKHRIPGGKPDRLYPKFGTGLWFLGRLGSDRWGLQYDAYLSNGRGANPYETDDNANKGVGARLVLLPPGRDLGLGGSVYRERNGAAAHTENTSAALQAQYDHRDWHVTAELAAFRLETVDGTGTPLDPFVPDGGSVHARASYLELGHRFADLLMPFARYDLFDPDTGSSGDREHDWALGLNASPLSNVVLKAELHLVRFDDTGRRDFELGIVSVAVGF